MEINWKTLVNNKPTVGFKSLMYNYKNYVCDEELNQEQLYGLLGNRYFIFDLYYDEIVEMFYEMIQSKHCNFLVDTYSFMLFLFTKKLYNKEISEDEAYRIYNQYIGYITKDSKGRDESHSSKFILELTQYNNFSEEREDYVHQTLLSYLKELKYE